MSLVRKLTEADKKSLEQFDRKQAEVKDNTKACILGFQTGLLLFGPGGTGKSHTIGITLEEEGITRITSEDVNTLNEGKQCKGDDEDQGEEGDDESTLNRPKFGKDSWISHQGRITPKGLVLMMKRFPESIHVIEDAETLFDDKNAWGVLRMALHSQDKARYSERSITWNTSDTKGSFNFTFTGSLIIVGNRMLPKDSPEVDAVKQRCPTLTFALTNDELVAKMKSMCIGGYKKIPGHPISEREAFDTLDFIITELNSDPNFRYTQLNLRMLDNGMKVIAMTQIDDSINWRQMLLTQMQNQIGAKPRRSERISDEKALAKELATRKFPTQKAKLVEWCKIVSRSLEGSEAPDDSPEYKKWFNTTKSDLLRKSK